MDKITTGKIIHHFLEGCPSFAEKWQEHQAFYGEDQLPYVDLGAFAHHLVNLYERNQTEEFPAVFNIIERLFVEGDDGVKQAVTIGLLEAIQNTAGNNAKVFVPYLKSESVKWWNQLNDFWDGKVTMWNNPLNNI